MLRKSQRLGQRHLAALKQSMDAFKRAPWTMSTTVSVIAVTFMLPLLFWLLMGQLKPIADVWQTGKEMSLYLKLSFKATDEADLVGRIEATPGVEKAVFISAETSLIALEKQEGMTDVRRYLSDNPLPSMIEVTPTAAIDTPEKLEQLFQILKKHPEVELATLNRDWVSRLHAMLYLLTCLTWFLGGLFSLMVVFIIRNLLRLAAHEHHDEIQVMKLIGATDGFIIRPFLYTGAGLGALGAILAFFGAHMILLGLARALHILLQSGAASGATVINFSGHALLGTVLFGLGLGWLGAYLPLKHQLAHIEPCH